MRGDREALGEKKDRWILWITAIAMLAAGLGLRDPWPADEPRFALVAKQMVTSGQWFFPMRGLEYYSDKPPLFMWGIAFFLKLTGSMRLAFLLPSLLSSLVTLGVVMDMGRRLWGHRGDIVAGCVLLSTFQFVLQAKTAQIDAMLCMWTTLALYGVMRHLLFGPAWGWYGFGFFAMGLGVITKGVGFLPLFMGVPWIFGRVRGWRYLSPLPWLSFRWLTGPPLFFLAIGLWLLPMLWWVSHSGDPALDLYRDDILFTQTVQRYGASWTHIRPFWYYLVEVIPFFWLPVTLWLPWLVPAWYQGLKDRDGRLLLLLGWVVCVVLFFSGSAGKRGVYMLPAIPALVLAVTPFFSRILQASGAQCLMLWLLRVIGVVVLAICGVTLVIPMERVGQALLRYEVNPYPLLFFLGGTALTLGLGAGRRRAFQAAAIFGVCFWVVHGLWLGPILNAGRSSAPLMARVGSMIGPSAELGLVSWKEQTLLYADRPAMTFGFRHASRKEQLDRARLWRQGGPHRWLLVPNLKEGEGFDPDKIEAVGWKHRRTWYLVAP